MTVSKDNAQIVVKVLSDDNKEEKKRAFAKLEQLRKKRKVTDDKTELESNRENKYGNSKSENLKRKPVDWDSFVIPSGRSTEEIDNYIREMREDRIIPYIQKNRYNASKVRRYDL